MKSKNELFHRRCRFALQSRYLSLLFVFVGFCSLLNSVTYHINQDGTGDFTTIQEGIIASTDSDTVLVYPGIYYENINYNAKSITIASLYLTTQNEQYIDQTIINGNQTGSCVRIMSGEDETTLLCGFTLTNGSGSPYYEDGPILGGGILIKDSQPIISSSKIQENNAYAGGGILCMNSQISLVGVSITNNHTYKAGGGIFLGNSSEIIFDNEVLCNIFLNYASGGCEIAKTSDCPPLEVNVDTFTVFEPDGYFISSTTSTGIPLNDVTLNMQNAKLYPVNADLYVSTEGNNNNSGLTSDEPLKNINFALSLVKSDTLHPNTIHIADGIYSNSLNNDCFPLNMRGYVSLEGESMENTIFDAEGVSYHISDGYSKLDYRIKNIKLTNGTGSTVASIVILAANQQFDKFVNLENITITDCYAYTKSLKLFYMDLSIKNIHSYSNDCTLLWALNSYQSEQEVIIENAYIHDNHQYDPTSMSSDAGPQLSFGMLCTEPMNVTITNMELTENIQTQSDWPESSSGVSVGDNINLDLINCTIGNNSSPGDGGAVNFFPGQNSTINIYNSILYGDNPGEIYIDNEFSSNPSTLNIQNSLVYGGEDGIGNPYSWNVINWNEGNLSAFADPLWQNSGEFPYALTGDSPCIDAGTLDLPAGIELPQFDLAGNPRIYGETIDMGAYEYQDSVSVQKEIITPITQTQLSNYPNPFNPTTTIKLELAESGKIELAIFNIKGQKVKTLINAYSAKGHFEIIWRGTDDNKKKVSSGQYFIKLKVNYEEKTTRKCVLLK